jgi:outer membrane protein TolC
MNLSYFSTVIKIAISSFLIAGCQNLEFAQLKSIPLLLKKSEKDYSSVVNNKEVSELRNEAKPLNEILDSALADQNDGKDFVTTIASALLKDPVIISQKRKVEAKLAAIASSEARKEYQVTSTLYGGIEDITDNTKGVALALSASRLIFDGGLLDSQIESKSFEAEAAKQNLKATFDERAFKLGKIWLELEKYESLKKQIDERLAVLDPLIGQLEQVADAGIGDISKVTAAQRTVSAIRVTQTNIAEGRAKARLEYLNTYGSVKETILYDHEFTKDLIAGKITEASAQNAPLLLAKYANYQAALANLEAVKSKNDFNIGFEARALRPFAGSGYDSDESVGLVARKTLFNGGMYESEVSEAEAMVESSLAEVEATFRQGIRVVNSAQQSIESMDKAIALARDNARVTTEEILYLRQQLVIGGSTLDSVLSAEARLYEAVSKEIQFLADKRMAELLIASTLGLLSPALGIK